MSIELNAVAFDLDGTLYPNYRFYVRLIPFMLRRHRLLRAMGRARDALRAATQEGRFYDLQARIMAEILQEDPLKIQQQTEQLIYRGWEPLFKGLELFPHVRETLGNFKDRGYKLGLLSDFPPEKKLEYLGLTGLWDSVLCSEETGRLKPDPAPFLALCRALDCPAEKVLYVGNSLAYDVRGAKSVGMKTALIASRTRRFLSATAIRESGVDFIFSDYRQLRAYVLS